MEIAKSALDSSLHQDHPDHPVAATATPATQVPKSRNARITLDDAELVAAQVARGLSESAACWKVGKFSPKQWYEWKSRGKRGPKVANIIARVAAARVSNMAGEIEKAATGTAGVRHDWRAAQVLAGLVAPEFRPDRGEKPAVSNTLAIFSGGEAGLRKMIEAIAGAPALPARPAVPAVVDCPVADQDEPAPAPSDAEPGGKD